jgi:hypothetical protein
VAPATANADFARPSFRYALRTVTNLAGLPLSQAVIAEPISAMSTLTAVRAADAVALRPGIPWSTVSSWLSSAFALRANP